MGGLRKMRSALRRVAPLRRATQARWQRSMCAIPAPAEDGSKPAPPQKVMDLADSIVSLNLLEASQLSDVLKDRLGISDAVMMPQMGVAAPSSAPGAGGGEEEAAEEKTSFDVVLSGFDASAKIKVIKEVRTITSLGLKEAKTLVEGSPNTLKEGITKEQAD